MFKSTDLIKNVTNIVDKITKNNSTKNSTVEDSINTDSMLIEKTIITSSVLNEKSENINIIKESYTTKIKTLLVETDKLKFKRQQMSIQGILLLF